MEDDDYDFDVDFEPDEIEEEPDDFESRRSEHAFSLDVGWLRELDDEPRSYENLELAIHLVDFVKAKDARILLDSEGGIEREYRNVLRRDSVGWHISEELRRYFTYASASPTKRTTAQLDKIHFDPSDRKYVVVAQKGEGIYITHETKHVQPLVRRHLRLNCGIDVFDRAAVRRYLDSNVS